jgi:hypothetical protein
VVTLPVDVGWPFNCCGATISLPVQHPPSKNIHPKNDIFIRLRHDAIMPLCIYTYLHLFMLFLSVYLIPRLSGTGP